MNSRALSALMNAIREHCTPAIRESVDWAALDFIAARYTWHGNPVIVTVG